MLWHSWQEISGNSNRNCIFVLLANIHAACMLTLSTRKTECLKIAWVISLGIRPVWGIYSLTLHPLLSVFDVRQRYLSQILRRLEEHIHQSAICATSSTVYQKKKCKRAVFKPSPIRPPISLSFKNLSRLSAPVPYYLINGAQSRLKGLKSWAWIFQFRRLLSVSIFSILNHPCSFMVYCYLFGVFLSL